MRFAPRDRAVAANTFVPSEPPPVYLSYFGTGDPAYYKVPPQKEATVPATPHAFNRSPACAWRPKCLVLFESAAGPET